MHAFPRRSPVSGFTLAEVMITMFLISLMCLGVFAGLQQITKAATSVALRTEGHHLLQAESERLLSADFASFAASGNQTITSSFKTSYAPSTVAALVNTSADAAGRVLFTRRTVELASTTSSRTLRVEVQWTWQGRTTLITAPLYRTNL